MVQEFRVSSNAYGASRADPAVRSSTLSTKSGGNHVHGQPFITAARQFVWRFNPFLAFKPHNRQQQVGGTIGGPIKANKIFFFLGFDHHVFHVPNVVEFLDGSTRVTPVAGTPAIARRLRQPDQDLVVAAAARLSSLTGEYPAAQIGNSAYAKLDFNISTRHQLGLRVNTTRYWGANNVFLDSASPVTYDAISNNGQEFSRKP